MNDKLGMNVRAEAICCLPYDLFSPFELVT